jgi:hypothetical protein
MEAGTVSVLAYRAVFGVIGLSLAMGILAYVGVKDSRPRTG